jgi:hypothetical protein
MFCAGKVIGDFARRGYDQADEMLIPFKQGKSYVESSLHLASGEAIKKPIGMHMHGY